MFLTLLAVFFLQGTPINQTKMTEVGTSKPVAVFEYTQPEGIPLEPAQPTVIATFKLEK